MKAQTSTHAKTAKIVILYLPLVYALAILFTSCQSVRHQERSGCYAAKRLSRYGTGGYQYKTRINTRHSF
jgi:hypothetical protein